MTGRAVTLLLALSLAATGRSAAQAGYAARIDSVFAEFDRADSPGCAVGVVRDGRLVYAKGYGMANLERAEPLTPSTVFYLASVSKQFTAASVGVLAVAGRLSLDDDVRRYVPELPDYGHRITIRHLVHHTSGLRDYLELMDMAGMSLEEPQTPTAILALVARQRATNFTPGERYLYSNTGYFLIPIIVERVTGQAFREWADASIFRPLGMRETHFHDDWQHEVPHRALAYRRAEDGGFELDFLPHFDQVGSGGVLSTVEDLARWDRNFSDPAVGGPAFLALQHTRGLQRDGDTLSYALGLDLDEYKGAQTVEHGGSMMGFRTYWLRFPGERLTVICLCNLANSNPGALSHQVADIYLADRFHRALSAYGGSYHSPELDATWTVHAAGGELTALGPRGETVPLRPSTRDRFRLPRGAEVRFLRDGAGMITGFQLDSSRAQGIRFERTSP